MILGVLAGCGPRVDPGVTVLAMKDFGPVLTDFLVPIGDPNLKAELVTDPAREAEARGGFVIALVPQRGCSGCYSIKGDGKRLTVLGDPPLGLQYGLAHALELYGYGFFHPWHTRVPATLLTAPSIDEQHSPQLDLRRGLHLHTLHPTESLYDFWVPSPASLEGAQRTVDFVIKNRGNYLQWCALDDITKSTATLDAWRTHNAAILEYAHRRGITTGVGIQLFGKSNLQNAFDLIDEDPDPGPEMKRRLHLLLDGQPFDNVNLSFGEFFAADPAVFVDQVNAAYAAIQEARPGVEVSAPIHVGNYPNLRVTYMGTTQLYYFLVRYANPAITPWIHSVMYFNLFEDAGLAYLHDEFDEHRAFLEDRLKNKQPVSYFPESAYWIAFDNSIPTYLPLYMRSRWLDLTKLTGLRDHVLFSSGWEWGYWQTDAATLRMTYQVPADWSDYVRSAFTDPKVGDLIHRLGEVEHDGLIGKRLAGYVSGRDQIIDAGKKLGIISQPDRIQFDELAQLMPAQRQAFSEGTLSALQKLADDASSLDAELKALNLDAGDRFVAELQDGFDVTARRFRFVLALYRATESFAAGNGDGGFLAKADAELEAAKLTVAKRRRALHDPDPKPILRDTPNPTFYQYGYLREADSLCFWVRERAQARALILGTGDFVPGCIL